MRWRDPFRDETGLTSAGMVLALLLTLSLVFSAGQVCRVNAAASEVQNVADAAALAAENEVAEFMVVVRVCDAVVLSLSLTSLVATGLGVVALCVPTMASASETLLKAGRDVSHARDSFAEKAASGLNRLQRLLPFFSGASAASVAAANNAGASNYVALAVLAPFEGKDIAVGAHEGASTVQDEVDRDASDVKRAAEEAERAAEQANEAKRTAFERDCGANPEACMYERASALAGMSGLENPLYKSVDAWSFSVALKRAQAYYPRRLAMEVPEGSSVGDRARSALRSRFYAFASEEVARGYVRETEDAFDALFPRLPKNTAEMRATSLYTEAVYPCTTDSEGRTTMHAWPGCPGASGADGFGSIAHMEAGSYLTCAQCEFSASSMGKVAAASSSIENGFEYHYEAVAVAAERYEKARAELDPLSSEVKSRVSGLLDRIREAVGHAGDMRISAEPPGRFGVVVLAANTGREAASSGFASSFVQGSQALGARAAVSAATLGSDPSGEGANVISSVLDGLPDAGVATDALSAVLDCWSALLESYARGQEALDDAVSTALDGMPLAGNSGLGPWAARALRDAIAAVGLQPANLDALKPVLVNSAHVARADGSAFSARLLTLKEQAIAHPAQSNDVFTSMVGAVEQGAIEEISSFDGKVQIAVVELLGEGGPSVPIEITLPPVVKDAAIDVVERAADEVRAVYAHVTGVRVWE